MLKSKKREPVSKGKVRREVAKVPHKRRRAKPMIEFVNPFGARW